MQAPDKHESNVDFNDDNRNVLFSANYLLEKMYIMIV